MSEKLRLEAEFRDKGVSSGLKKIGGELALIKKTPGMTEAHKWLGEFNERANGFVKEGGGIKSVMSGIGIGGLTAATSVAELVKSFSDLAARTADLKEVSRQTGLTVDEVNRLQRAGEKLYIDPSKMSAGLQTLSDRMFDFRRHMGDLYGQLAQEAPDFARKLDLEKPQEQIRDIFAWLSRIKDPQLQRRWTEAFMGDGDLARLLTNGGRDFAQAMREAAQSTASITPDMQAKADLLHNAILDFNHEWQDFQTTVAPAVFEQLRFAMADLKGVFGDIKQVYDWIVKAQADPVGTAKGVLDQADKAFDDKAQEVGDRWHGRVQSLKEARDNGTAEDANALHRNDVAPLDWIAKQKALERASHPDPTPKEGDNNKSLWGRLFHRSAFMEGGEGGGLGFGGATDMITEGTKQGVLAAFRDMMAEKDAERDGHVQSGIQNAAFTTYDDDRSGRSNGYGLKGLGQGDDAAGTPNRGGHDSSTHAGTSQEVVDYIREAAAKRGIDPDVAVAVANSEGLKGYDPKDGKPDQGGDQGTSFSPWQLHYRSNKPGFTSPGLGDDYTAATGHQASDKRFWKEQTDFALDHARRNGWGPWHGAANTGIGAREGIGVAAGPGNGLASNAVDNAAKLLGMGSNQAAQALGKRMSPGQWCADFVNGALHSADVKGTNSSLALSFKNWGQRVGASDVKKGDVMVEDHGGGHGHVGLATGNVRRDASGRVTGIEMISGNHGNRVGRGWDSPDELAAIRRAPPPSDEPKRQLNLPEVARKSGTTEQTIRHEGGAAVDINLHSDGSVRSTRAKSRGLVTAVNLSRGPTMMLPSSTA